ncbi:hypothetical protein, partial [Streptomyces odonnellii]|uniref:hypothetical protein n=1 Tax=Streptomyces odonnellii TaxID=1417980 RepID=UPI0006263A38
MNGRLVGGTLPDTEVRDGETRAGQARERDLLETGAVLPLRGTESAAAADGTSGRGSAGGSGDTAGAGGGEGDVLTARAYAHPALDERTVVRLVPGAIGAA